MKQRYQRFIDFYISTGGNAAEAARQAGYSAKVARQVGSKLLNKPEICRAIDDRLKAIESQRIAKQQELLEHLTAVVRGEITETVVTNSGKSFEVAVSERDRLKAVEMLLKVYGAFREKVEVKVDSCELFVDTLTKIWQE